MPHDCWSKLSLVALLQRMVSTLLVSGIMWSPRLSIAEENVQFNRDIRPILSNSCLFCHGPDKQQRKAGLRLDVRESAVRRKAIVPGKPDKSELVDRILTNDPDLQMPPPASNKKLTPEQKALLQRWIAEGAEYRGHWAYERPLKASIPQGAHAIDHLVRQRLLKLGLKQSPKADRRTLARRLYFDLIGIPPTPEDVDGFVNDLAPDACEKLVEKLLASPHYGERMALGWLDVVRYADTIGYHSDNPRNVWPYRDYVIRSFNENKPFDQFTIEQLAGDLLPNSTQEQKVASGFNRLLLTTEEGGAQPKDYEVRMLCDRVRAVGTVWLGQTLGCCQCHDHKFDPSTMRDFYSMGAFFADIQEPLIGSREPGMLVSTPGQTKERLRLLSTVAALQKQFDSPQPTLMRAQEVWEKEMQTSLRLPDSTWTPLRPDKAISEQGAPLEIDSTGAVHMNGNPPHGTDTYRLTIKTKLRGITGIRLDVLKHPSLPQQGPGRAENGNFVLTEFSITDEKEKPITLAHASATFEQEGYPAAATIDGNMDKGNGWALYGAIGTDQSIYYELKSPLQSEDEGTLVLVLRQLYGENHTLGRFRLSATTSTKPIRVHKPRGLPPELIAILRLDPSKRNAKQKERLTQYFKHTAPSLHGLRTQLAQARKTLADFESGLPRCLVSVATDQLRTVKILPRGDWMNESGIVVKPAVPHFLPQISEGTARRLNRLDLARWLVARDNPLTARVLVNRIWRQFFGLGICKTHDDLGTQGDWPTNPELLDWLACELVDRGWDIKHIVRTIVHSQTYQQVSTASKEMQKRDPENRECARQSRFRLDAELVRDNALRIAGLLVPTIGGPSVKPYQPDGYWENLNFPPRQYIHDTGAQQYRRGLYTWWQRTFLHPSLLAFDASTREECAAERTRSNIPQQALALLNDPTYVEAARTFAARILKEGGKDETSRFHWAWRQVLQRAPSQAELQAAATLLHKHSDQYAHDPQAAAALLKVGLAPVPKDLDAVQLAAWTSVARVLLNLHETVTRN